MVTIFFSISLTLIATLSLYAISLWFNPKKVCPMLPPGFTGLPIIGETLDFVRSSNVGYPENFISDRMNKYSFKAFLTSLMGQKVVVFCGASGNKCVFSSENKFLAPWTPPSIKKIIISPENRDRELSKFKREGRDVTNLFMKPEVLHKTFIGIIDYISKQHIKTEWSPYERVFAHKLANKYTFTLACRLFVSIEDPVDVKRLEGLFKSITTGMMSIPVNFPGTRFNRALKSGSILRKEIQTIIAQRKSDILNKKLDIKTSKDMLSQMLLSKYEDDGEFPSDLVVADMILGFLIAGHDTASTAITFIVNYLAELPQVYAEALKEQLEIARNKKEGELLNWEDIKKMKYSWSVANETMRLAPPSGGNFREAITDFTFAGFTIPKGWKAYWTVHSTNKNPEYFKDPEKFDPTRFYEKRPEPYSFVPFGGGTHICPGREYARAEILVFMHNLVTQFGMEKLVPDEARTYTIGAIPVNGLPIRLHPRK